LGLPPLNPESPWHGYSLGDWTEEWDRLAERAAAGDYLENGKRSAHSGAARALSPIPMSGRCPDWDKDQGSVIGE
jgi:4-hydroxy-3-polyprenylbenzoate decarboxylase